MCCECGFWSENIRRHQSTKHNKTVSVRFKNEEGRHILFRDPSDQKFHCPRCCSKFDNGESVQVCICSPPPPLYVRLIFA